MGIPWHPGTSATRTVGVAGDRVRGYPAGCTGSGEGSAGREQTRHPGRWFPPARVAPGNEESAAFDRPSFRTRPSRALLRKRTSGPDGLASCLPPPRGARRHLSRLPHRDPSCRDFLPRDLFRRDISRRDLSRRDPSRSTRFAAGGGDAFSAPAATSGGVSEWPDLTEEFVGEVGARRRPHQSRSRGPSLVQPILGGMGKLVFARAGPFHGQAGAYPCHPRRSRPPVSGCTRPSLAASRLSRRGGESLLPSFRGS